MKRRALNTVAGTSFSFLALAWGGSTLLAQESPKEPAKETKKEEEKTMTPAATTDAALAAIEKFIAEKKIDKSKDGWKTRLPKPEKATFDPKAKYFWHLKTNKGAIKIELLQQVAPMHVTSTIYLTKLGFYDDTIFHRVIDGFMAQGGDPLGVGSGGPGYEYGGEFDPKVKHNTPGLLSMANRGPNTDGSQFFLTFVPTPWLDGKHTIFGRVVEGMDTVKTLEKAGSPSGKTKEKLSIEAATISVEAAAKPD